MVVANPNSNLVFDFPDPTPRFEFNDPPKKKNSVNNNTTTTNSNTATKKGSRRLLKFGKGKASASNSNSNSDNNRESADASLTGTIAGTATMSSLNSSLQTSTSQPGRGDPLSLLGFDMTRPKSGDIAAGPQQQVVSSTLEPSTSSSKLALPSGPPSGGQHNHRRHPSDDVKSTSGYISEVSEFSFDRVTVTTAGEQSSNVSWGFLDDTVLNAVGAVGGGQRQSAPYTGGANKYAMDDGGNNAVVPTSNNKRRGSKKNLSSGTFSNVSISDDEMDDIHYTGVVKNTANNSNKRNGNGANGAVAVNAKGHNVDVHNQILTSFDSGCIVSDSSQSVISEISDPGLGVGPGRVGEAVRDILRDGADDTVADMPMLKDVSSPPDRISDLAVVAASMPTLMDPKSASAVTSTLMKAPTPSKGGTRANRDESNSPSRDTRTTAKSTLTGCTGAFSDQLPKNFLRDLQTTYAQFKMALNDKNKSGGNEDNTNNNTGMFQSFVEDVQFCGLYFCGLDTTDCCADADEKKRYEDSLKKKKEERKREADDTFLGKVIAVCGEGQHIVVNECGDWMESERHPDDATVEDSLRRGVVSNEK